MRDLGTLELYRSHYWERSMGMDGDYEYGLFIIPSPIDGRDMAVMATNAEGWDHLSVSRINRCPNWPEMEHVKRLFFREDETAMQLHVPPSDHKSLHPFCLHIWRPHGVEIPRPPVEFLGIPEGTI